MSTFIANVYELWGTNYLNQFSEIMFQNDFYVTVALYTFPTALVITFLYYYILDRPATSKLWFWLLIMIIVGAVGFIISYVTVENSFYGIQLDPVQFGNEILIFSATNFLYSILAVFVFSVLIKWKSKNSSHVPF